LPLVLSGLTALSRILLFAPGRWPAGPIGLGLALPSLAAFAEAAKRKPDPRLGAPPPRRLPRDAGAGRRRRRVGRRGHARAARAPRPFSGYAGEDDRPGEAALANDAVAVARLEREISALDECAEEKKAELQAIADRTAESIRNARMSAQETMAREAPAGPETVE
jgi:hypothetical protein